MGLKKKSEDQGHLIVANEGGAQCTRSGNGMDGYTNGSCCGDKVGHGALPVRASGGIWRGEERLCSMRKVCGRPCPQEKKKERDRGVRHGDKSVGVES